MQLYYIYLGTLKSTDAWFHLQDSDLTGRSRDSLAFLKTSQVIRIGNQG